MCACPVLAQPDFNKQFYLQMDTSAYGVGAVLLQEGEAMTSQTKTHKPKLHPIAYYSATFIPAERKYNIYKRELLAMMKSLTHWRHYLEWTKKHSKSLQIMPTSSIGNPQRTLTTEQPDGMLTSRNTIMKSNMSRGKPIYQQTHCHNHPEQTRAKMTIKMS